MKISLYILLFSVLTTGCDNNAPSEKHSPRLEVTYFQPKLNIVNGVVDPESVIKIYDEIDYQRAVQLYHWAIPLVGTHGWERANRIGNIGPYDLGSYAGYDNVAGIMTPNQVVDYLIAFPVLDKPVVLENPEGFSAGMVMDYWQNTIQQIGSVGPNKGKHEKILLIGPGVKTPENTEGYEVVHVPTRVAFVGTRNMITEPEDHQRFNQQIRLYPYGNEDKAGIVKPVLAKDTESGLAYLQRQPHGMEYWEALNEIIQREVVLERNIIFTDMLEKLGIKKGDSFKPTEKQKQRFIAAEYQANINASVNSYSTRLKGKKFWKDSNWLLPLAVDPSNQHHDLDGKAAWYWEAISSSPAMVTKTVGVGSTYLGLYADENGHGFDGGKKYQFVVPAKIPARQFWTVTLYDNGTRSLLLNDTQNAELGSLSDLVYNSDGSATFTFSPEKGSAKNWIQTNPGENWFTWFRLYQPEQEYFDKSFFLPNIKLDAGNQQS